MSHELSVLDKVMRIPACQPASPPAAPLPALWPVEKVHTYHTFGKFSQGLREKVHTYHAVVKVFFKKCTPTTPL